MSNIKPWRERTSQNVTGAMQAEITDLRTLITSMEAQEPVGFITGLNWDSRQSEQVQKITRNAQPEYGFTVPLFFHPAQPVEQPTCDMGAMCLQCPDRDANDDYKRGFSDGMCEFKEIYESQPIEQPKDTNCD